MRATLFTSAALLALSSSVLAAPSGLLSGVSSLLTQYPVNLPLNITSVTKTVTSALGDQYHVTRVNSTLDRGLAWAGNWDYIASAAQASLVNWYYHWENPRMDNMPSDFEFVPMYWGQAKSDQWAAQQAQFNQSALPKHILAQNEPDVPTQSNENAWQAASNWIQQLLPYQQQGVKISTPAIVWNTGWMDNFLAALKKQGAQPDFMAIHWYGSYWDTDGFQQWVEQCRARYGLPIWVTEIGITSASNATSDQVAQFVQTTTNWLQNQTYVERAAWFGAFDTSSPPDSFGSANNAFWWPGGSLTGVGKAWMFNNGTSTTGLANYQALNSGNSYDQGTDYETDSSQSS